MAIPPLWVALYAVIGTVVVAVFVIGAVLLATYTERRRAAPQNQTS